MKKTLLICICTLCLFVCNIQTVFGVDGANVTVTDYGSYTVNSYVSTSTTTYSIGNVTVQGPSVGFIYVYEYQMYHYYHGQIRFTFNEDISGCDWFIEGHGVVFQSSYAGTYITVGLNGCNSFKLTVIKKNSNSPLTLSNTQYITMTNVDDTTDVSTILHSIDGHIDGVETLLNTISSNISSIKGYVDGIEGYIDGLEGYTDNIEGYIDNIESYLSTIVTNTGVQNGISLIQIVNQLLGIFTSSVQNAPSLYDIIDGLLETANNIKGLFDDVNLDNSDVVSSINNLQNIRFQVQDLEMPFYQYLFFSVLTRSNMTLVKYDESNVPYVEWKDIKNLVKSINVNKSSDIEFCYYVNSRATNRIKLDGSYGHYDRGLGSATRFANYSSFSLTTGTHVVEFGRSDDDSSLNDSDCIYPIYMGFQGYMPNEIALLFNLDTIDNNIYKVLLDLYDSILSLDLSVDNTELLQALQSLESAITGLQNQVTVNNTISVNSHDIPYYQYSMLTMLASGNTNKIHFDDAGAPYVLWSEVKNNIMRLNPGVQTNITFAYWCNYVEVVPKFADTSYTRIRGFGNSIRYASMYQFLRPAGNCDVTWYKTNDTAISDNTRIYPIYLGRSDAIPPEVAVIFGVQSTANQYTTILNSLNTLATSLDLNFSNYSAEMTAQVDALVVAMDSLLEFNLNLDSLFDSLFEVNFDELFGVDINIDLSLLDDMLINIGSLLGGNIETIVDYHDIWLQQYDLLDLDTKLTVPQEIQSGANALGNMFEQIVASDGTIGFITYSSLSIGLFGLYLGLRREKK